MDDTSKLTIRQVDTFTTVIGNFGGFAAIIYVVCYLLLAKFQTAIYYTSLIKSCYMY